MTRKKEIQIAVEKYFPIPENGRCLECSCGASGFEIGTKWADRTMIEKACEWLSYHLDTKKIDVNYKFEIIEEFRKAMEE